MARDGQMLCTNMTKLSQFVHPIGLKFHQHKYVTTLFNPNDQDSNMNFAKSSGLGTSIKFNQVGKTLTKF